MSKFSYPVYKRTTTSNIYRYIQLKLLSPRLDQPQPFLNRIQFIDPRLSKYLQIKSSRPFKIQYMTCLSNEDHPTIHAIRARISRCGRKRRHWIHQTRRDEQSQRMLQCVRVDTKGMLSLIPAIRRVNSRGCLAELIVYVSLREVGNIGAQKQGGV